MTLKHLTKALICNAVVALALNASPVTLQDPIEQGKAPITVTLSDGRIVPYGAGIICTEECPMPTLEAERRRNRWLVPGLLVGGAITTVCLLCCDEPPTGLLPPVSQPPSADVPESEPLFLTGLGLWFVLAARRLKKNESTFWNYTAKE